MIYQVPREQLFVCPKLQGLVLWRLLFYWLACLTLSALAVVGWSIFCDPEATAGEHVRRLAAYFVPALAVGLVLLPVVIVDCITLSNRFLGPLVRLRGSIRRLATDDHVMPLHFRESDFWHEFAVEYGELVERVERMKERAAVHESDAMIAPYLTQ
ncbi:MAG TPA: hypothetical protein VHZ24_06185 [Pirellulales bacterium]|jgi:hypothetical protein|nr:hypothetical protein [Pirellulales bacterium]